MLFEKTGLEQGTGDLKERWGQGGSAIVNFTAETSTDGTIYTVTAGKTLFVKTIIVCNTIINGGGTFHLKDGTAGAVKFHVSETYPDQSKVYTFSCPLKFETEVYCNEVTDTNSLLTISGWEE